MRPLAIVVLSLLALAVAGLVGWSLLGDAGGGPAGSVILVGDSLNVGIEPYLADRLDGWTIRTDDVVGRSGPQGLAELEALGGALAPVVVVSLGTNDEQTDVARFHALVESVVAQAGPKRCVVWSTVWRNGPNPAFDGVLRDAARRHRNLHVADWAALVGGSPELLAADGVHGTPEGYARKAEQVARLVERCRPPA
jgi:lysophospholipase L1-like esterase